MSIQPTDDDLLNEVDYLRTEIDFLNDRICDLSLDEEGWQRETRKAEAEVIRLRERIHRAMDLLPMTDGTKEARRILRLARVRSSFTLDLRHLEEGTAAACGDQTAVPVST